MRHVGLTKINARSMVAWLQVWKGLKQVRVIRNSGALVAAITILVAAAMLRSGAGEVAIVPACLGAIGLLLQYANPMNSRDTRRLVLFALGFFAGCLSLSAALMLFVNRGPVALLLAAAALALVPLMLRARVAYRQIPQYRLVSYYQE